MDFIKKQVIHRTTINYWATPADKNTAGSMLYFDNEFTAEELEKKLEALKILYPEMSIRQIRSTKELILSNDSK